MTGECQNYSSAAPAQVCQSPAERSEKGTSQKSLFQSDETSVFTLFLSFEKVTM